MESKVCLLIVVSFFIGSDAIRFDQFEEQEDFKQLMNILSKPRSFGRDRKTGENDISWYLSSFSWNSCGGDSDLAKVTSLSIGPDPLEIPGNVTLAVDATLKKPISSPIKLDLSVKKKIFVWIDIPCVDNVGSCVYDDVCALLPKSCPPIFAKYGIPCQCPVKAASYHLPSSSFLIPSVAIPSFLKDGDYKVEAKLSTQGQQVLCLDIELSIKA